MNRNRRMGDAGNQPGLLGHFDLLAIELRRHADSLRTNATTLIRNFPRPIPDDQRLAAGASRTIEAAFTLSPDERDVEPVVEVRVIHRRGPLSAGPASVPWEPRRYDAPPEIEWMRLVR